MARGCQERIRAKKNTERTEVMREAGEYAVGIFHGSIMAIQSGSGNGSVGRGTCRFDVEENARFIRKRGAEGGGETRVPARERRHPLHCVLHPSQRDLRRCFLSVSGQPNGERCVTESPGGEMGRDGTGTARRGRDS